MVARYPLVLNGTSIQELQVGDSVAGAGDGDVTGPASSVANEIALFSDITGKVLKSATGSGLAKLTSGVLSTATAGTDYIAPSGALGTPSSGTLTNCTADGTNKVGYLNVPQNAQGAYTLVLTDAGKHIYKTSTSAVTHTIPENSSVAFPIGTAVTFVNGAASGDLTIAITTDTMRLAEAGTTGSRTLKPYGVATAIKVASTTWIISGTGLS